MDFKSLKVKEILADPELMAVITQIVPGVKNYPLKLFGGKTCGELFELAVKTGLATAEEAKDAEQRINEALKNR